MECDKPLITCFILLLIKCNKYFIKPYCQLYFVCCETINIFFELSPLVLTEWSKKYGWKVNLRCQRHVWVWHCRKPSPWPAGNTLLPLLTCRTQNINAINGNSPIPHPLNDHVYINYCLCYADFTKNIVFSHMLPVNEESKNRVHSWWIKVMGDHVE